jgi:GMP synthase (glutamine-hydrolysing)
MLIVMGGPQSPLAISAAPYLADEVSLVRQALQKNIHVLGFCLGAQLIGEALGAVTSRSPEKEVGVYPIHLTLDGLEDPLLVGFGESFPVIHWHNDMPGTTADAVLLASSQGCPRQIVRYRKNVYGFQCHLEITQEGIADMIQAVPDDLKPSKFTQSAEVLMVQDYASINRMMFIILDRFSKIEAS